MILDCILLYINNIIYIYIPVEIYTSISIKIIINVLKSINSNNYVTYANL